MTQPESPLAPLIRVLDWSFRLGRFFGTEVRVYGVWLILLLFMLLPLHAGSLLPLGELLLVLVLGLLLLYATVWIHEMGHVVAARRYHIRTPLITLSPLGGLAHLQGAAPSPRADIFIALCGPLTHLIALAVVYPLALLVDGEPFYWVVGAGSGGGVVPVEHVAFVPWTLDRLCDLNLTLLLFNLLPIWPLDGGRVLRSLMALRMHPNRATLIAARIGMVGAVALAVYALVGSASNTAYGRVAHGFLFALAITNFLACRQAVREARHSDGPYGEPREPWEEDPDAWKHGTTWDEPAPRTRSKGRRHPEREAPGQDELDRLLDRVKEVGLAGLSEAERAALLRASEARRAGH